MAFPIPQSPCPSSRRDFEILLASVSILLKVGWGNNMYFYWSQSSLAHSIPPLAQVFFVSISVSVSLFSQVCGKGSGALRKCVKWALI